MYISEQDKTIFKERENQGKHCKIKKSLWFTSPFCLDANMATYKNSTHSIA